MTNNIRIDDKEFLKALDKLDRKQTANLVIEALDRAGQLLAEYTRQGLSKSMSRLRSEHNITKPKHRNWPMLAGIHVTPDKEYLNVMVSLYGDFRLKWFESGTEIRKLKRTGAKDRDRGKTLKDRRKYYRKRGKEEYYRKGSDRGRIEAMEFFAQARERDGEKVMAVAKQEIEKGLSKLLNT